MVKTKINRHFEMLPEIPVEVFFKMADAEKILSKSKRSISRYIKYGWLRPKKGVSRQGTLEYRFSGLELLDFVNRYNSVFQK